MLDCGVECGNGGSWRRGWLGDGSPVLTMTRPCRTRQLITTFARGLIGITFAHGSPIRPEGHSTAVGGFRPFRSDIGAKP